MKMKVEAKENMLIITDDDWQMVLEYASNQGHLVVAIGETNGMSKAAFIAPFGVVAAWIARQDAGEVVEADLAKSNREVNKAVKDMLKRWDKAGGEADCSEKC